MPRPLVIEGQSCEGKGFYRRPFKAAVVAALAAGCTVSKPRNFGIGAEPHPGEERTWLPRDCSAEPRDELPPSHS